jgi:phage protein D
MAIPSVPSVPSISGVLVYNTTFTILIGADKSSLVDITKTLPPMEQISLHYSDPISFQSDTLDLIFPDIGDQIITNNKVKKGIWIQVIIDQYNRDYLGSHTQRDLGTFMIDQIKQRGPPSQTTIMATAVPISSHIKLTIQNKVIPATSLKDVVTRIARQNGLDPVWDVKNPNKDRKLSQVHQYNESDLTLLSKLLKQNALSIKISNGKLIVFDEQEYELKPAVYKIDFTRPGAGIGMTEWELTTQSQDIYNTSQAAYFDPATAQLAAAKATDPMQTSGSGEQLNTTDWPYLQPEVGGEEIGGGQ